MTQPFRSLTALFHYCLQGLSTRQRRRPRPHGHRCRPVLECLEERLNPSTFSQSGNVLTITLDRASESLTLNANSDHSITIVDSATPTVGGSVTSGNVTVAGNTATITAAGVAAYSGGINVVDGGTQTGGSISFANSGTSTYSNAITVNLTNSSSGNITFGGTSTFNGVDLTASTVGGAVQSSAGSSLTLAGAADLSISASASQVVNLQGSVSVAGTTQLSGGGGISATTATNDFTGAVSLSSSAFGSVFLFDAAALNLGNVSLGSGSLFLTARGNITQASGSVISTGGAATFTIDTTSGSVLLGTSANKVLGTVTMGEANGGDLVNVSFRNISSAASLPSIALLGNAGDIDNYTLFFDNTGIVLPALNIAGALNVTAGGAITQGGALTAATASFTVLGNSAIDLAAFTNTINGALQFNSPQSSQAVQFDNSTNVLLGSSQLGRGTFSITAAGNITTASGAEITQKKGAVTATFTATGTTITLDGRNDFTGQVVLGGSSVTTVTYRNADALAQLASLTLPDFVTTLTVLFDNAPVVLPTLTLPNLTVTGQGIFQQTNAILTVNNATFNANGPIDLANANNLTNVQFNDLNSFGLYPVAIDNAQGLNFFGTSMLVGPLAVSAAGNIAE